MAAGHSSGMNNLTTLIKRLEAATSRLEDIASSASTFEPSPSHAGSISAASNAGPGSTSPSQTRQSSTTLAPSLAAEPLPKSIEAMDGLIGDHVKSFVDASKGLDKLIEEQASAVAKAFRDQRRFLFITTKAKKPDQQSKAFMDLLADLQQDIGTVGDIRDSNRASPLKEHLAMVGEGIQALQWLVMDGKPADFVGEVTGGAQMYGNRVLKAYKECDPTHVKFVQSYYALLKALQAYILKEYPSGVTWNSNGVDAAQAQQEIDSAPSVNGVAPVAVAPPPPPPPPPLPNFDNVPPPPPPPPANAGSAGTSDMGAVFDQLNRGEAVTAGLKKVDKSQMTHKNPSLRAAGTVPASTAEINRSRSPGPEIKPKPASMRQSSTSTMIPTKKPGRTELDGNKWLVENWDAPSAPIELDVSLSHSILISNCRGATIVVRGKANAISIDHSPRTQLLLDDLVSAVDVIASANVAVQVTGTLPTILLDQVDGATLYLSRATLDTTEVFTSKCSGVNIVLPPADDAADADSTECPVPEQIRTFIRDGKVVSEIVEHAG